MTLFEVELLVSASFTSGLLVAWLWMPRRRAPPGRVDPLCLFYGVALVATAAMLEWERVRHVTEERRRGRAQLRN